MLYEELYTWVGVNLTNTHQHQKQTRKHLEKKVISKEIFRDRPTRKRNCLWQPRSLMYQDEMSNLYRGLSSSIDASSQDLVHLAKRFQRRRFRCEKLTDDGHQVMAKAHISFVKVS